VSVVDKDGDDPDLLTLTHPPTELTVLARAHPCVDAALHLPPPQRVPALLLCGLITGGGQAEQGLIAQITVNGASLTINVPEGKFVVVGVRDTTAVELCGCSFDDITGADVKCGKSKKVKVKFGDCGGPNGHGGP